VEIKEIKDVVKQELDSAKNDINAVIDAKTKAATDKAASLELDVEGKIKAANDKVAAIEVKFDEIDKRIKESEIAAQRTRLAEETRGKSFEDRLKEAVDENHDNVQKFIKGENKKLNLELKAVGAVSTGSVSGSANYGAANDGKLVPLQNQIGHIRNLPNFTVRPYGPATDYYFMKEVAGEGSIAPTSETTSAASATTQATGLKPQFDIRFAEASVKFEWIAGWMLMSRKALMNIPGFLSTLNARLPEKLLDVEDAQILYGSGTSPEIKGILTSGNFVAGSAAGSTPLVEKIINDITVLEDTHKRLANGILLRPAQYNGMFLNKATGSGEYDLPPGVTFVNGVLYILGVPVAKTTALTSPDYVVGDFQNGAELLVQEAINIQLFDQDGTNVRTNQITARIEEYAALPVYGSNFFVKGSSALS
jgi:HK97 family phage major capsid protein